MGNSFKLQFVDAHTQEVLEETSFDSVDPINEWIKALETSRNSEHVSYIFDNRGRTLVAEYVACSKLHNHHSSICRLSFKTRLSDRQVKKPDNCFFIQFQ